MIHRFKTLDSTNTKAKAMALEGASHGTVVIADHQTKGRGRMGRSFDSPSGSGIYMSMILRPECPPADLMHLTCAAAVAVCDAVEQELGFRPAIKWINDLVVEGKKLAGILTELSINPKTGLVDFAIVGIGLNCNRKQEDFPAPLQSIACSASMITGQEVNQDALIYQIIYQLNFMNLSEKSKIIKQYRQDCITIGKPVMVYRGEQQHNGVALDVDENGALLVLFSNGHTEPVDSGEVSIRGQHGYAP